jgi:hypothetical protein
MFADMGGLGRRGAHGGWIRTHGAKAITRISALPLPAT